MKAIQLTGPGGPELLVIRDLPNPVCKPGEVLIRVQAVGLNYVDTLIRKGSHPATRQYPAVMPGEIEGIIENIGPEVTHLHPGQRVTGYAQAGYAEYATIPAVDVTLLPMEIPQGKGMLIHYLTAQNLLHQADGYKTLLVTAAAGGVGSTVIRMAKLRGIETIIGMVSTADKAAYILSLGASHALLYDDKNWPDQLNTILENQGIDLILESVGGQITASMLPRLGRGGTLVLYGNSSGEPSIVDISGIIMANNRILSARLYAAPAELRQQWTVEIIQWLLEGKLDVSISAWPLAGAPLAHRLLEERKTTGRVILQP